MKYGTRATLEATPRATEEVTVGDTVYLLREMSGTERDMFEASVMKPVAASANGSSAPAAVPAKEVDPLYFRARLVARCLVDENSERLYQDKEIKILSDNVPASTLSKLFTAAQKLNGLEPAAVDAAAKNSVTTPSDSLPSGSPDTSEKPLLNS